MYVMCPMINNVQKATDEDDARGQKLVAILS